jgi:sec-independent protein translocase protein TatA
MNLGPTELIIILVIVLLLFGTTRLPKLARSLGEASREFKKGVNERDEEEGAKPPAPAPVAPVVPAAEKDPNEQVTMSRAELDALLAERERNATKDVPPPAQG